MPVWIPEIYLHISILSRAQMNVLMIYIAVMAIAFIFTQAVVGVVLDWAYETGKIQHGKSGW